MSVVPGSFKRVGEKKGPLVIGGAEKKMNEDENFIYIPHPKFRVAGPKDDVQKWFEENKVGEKEVKEALKSAYTKTTLEKKTVREAFEREVKEAEEYKTKSRDTRVENDQVDLTVLVNILKQYKKQKKLDPSSVKTVVKPSVDLKAKISSLGDDKVLEVSNMNKKGLESKKVNFKESKHKRLSQRETDNLYKVVYDASSSTSSTGVKNFLNNYGSLESSTVKKIVECIKNGEVVNVSAVKSPTRSPLISPRRSTKSNVDDELSEL